MRFHGEWKGLSPVRQGWLECLVDVGSCEFRQEQHRRALPALPQLKLLTITTASFDQTSPKARVRQGH